MSLDHRTNKEARKKQANRVNTNRTKAAYLTTYQTRGQTSKTKIDYKLIKTDEKKQNHASKLATNKNML